MDCAEEVSLLRNELGPKLGVRDLQFDIFQAKMSVEFDEALIQPAEIELAVHAVGMRAEPWQAQPKAQTYWEKNRRKLATTFSGACLLLGMALQSLLTGNYLQTLLAHQHSHHVQLPWYVCV